jgi:ribose 5-phosphate isomerase A
VVASCAAKLVIVADFRKDSKVLGEQWKKGVPLEVRTVSDLPLYA